jgi:hypothetical protein
MVRGHAQSNRCNFWVDRACQTDFPAHQQTQVILPEIVTLTGRKRVINFGLKRGQQAQAGG